MVKDSTLIGRIKGEEYELVWDRTSGSYQYVCAGAVVNVSADQVVRSAKPASGKTRIDMGVYHTLRHLLHGILDLQSVNQLNVASM